MKENCLIIGSGPAALMAADYLSAKGIIPTIYERRPAAAWKLLVAGASGLNVTFDAAPEKFVTFYSERQKELVPCLQRFGPVQWLAHLEDLGEEPYLGSSHRYFVKNKSAASLLEAWTKRLESRGVKFIFGEEFKDFSATGVVDFASGLRKEFYTLLLCLGGASWETALPPWPATLAAHGLQITPLAPANAGFHFKAPQGFFERAQGKAIKGLLLSTARGTRQGELMITKYGLEGTPVYTVGCVGSAKLDLKPELTCEKLLERLSQSKGSPWTRVLKVAKLSDGALLLLEHCSPPQSWDSIESAVNAIKDFSIELTESRPLSESISTHGGISWDELNLGLELKKFPGIFCAGEMIDWDAPTGGFLLQACVSTAVTAAEAISRRLS